MHDSLIDLGDKFSLGQSLGHPHNNLQLQYSNSYLLNNSQIEWSKIKDYCNFLTLHHQSY